MSQRRLIGRRQFIRLSLASGAAMLLGGCAASPAPQPAAAPGTTSAPAAKPTSVPVVASTTAQEDLVLTCAVETWENGAFNPFTATGTNVNTLLVPYLERLTRMEFGTGGLSVAVPDIAEKWQRDPKTGAVDWYIRKGIKFHNGDDLTAKDVKFSIDEGSKDPIDGPAMRGLVKSVELLDDYTARFHPVGVAPYMVDTFGAGTPKYGLIAPKNYIEQHGYDYFNQHPVGSGRYKLVNFKAGDIAEYEAFQGHWRGAPAFKKLRVMQVPEEATRIAMLRRGDADMISPVSMDTVLEMEGEKEFTVKATGLQINAELGFLGVYLPEAAKYPSSNVDVRKALRLAIDQDTIIKQIFGGRATGPCIVQAADFRSDIDYNYWMKQTAKRCYYDPAEAKQLLSKAGYPDGFTMELIDAPIQGLSWVSDLCAVIAGYWQKIGVNTKIVKMTWSAFRKDGDPASSKSGYPHLGRAIVTGSSVASNCAEWTIRFFDTERRNRNYFWNGKGSAFPELQKMLWDATTETGDNAAIGKVLEMAAETRVDNPICRIPFYAVLGPRVLADFPHPYRHVPEAAVEARPTDKARKR